MHAIKMPTNIESENMVPAKVIHKCCGGIFVAWFGRHHQLELITSIKSNFDKLMSDRSAQAY